MKIRVRAVIIKDNKVLLIKRTKESSVYWVVPGGGVEDGETAEEALIRECEEELGVKIKINSLLVEIESGKLETFGQKEYFYLCNILDGVLGSGQGPEFQKEAIYTGAYNIEWRDIKSLLEIDLRPGKIRDLLLEQYL